MSAAQEQDQVAQDTPNQPGLSLIACPTSQIEKTTVIPSAVGRYNAKSLAGQALSLAESLSPSYMQVYVNSLEDFSALKELSQKKKR